MKREKFCFGCDTDFVIKSESKESILYCPFCGADLSDDENVDDDVFNDDD